MIVNSGGQHQLLPNQGHFQSWKSLDEQIATGFLLEWPNTLWESRWMGLLFIYSILWNMSSITWILPRETSGVTIQLLVVKREKMMLIAKRKKNLALTLMKISKTKSFYPEKVLFSEKYIHMHVVIAYKRLIKSMLDTLKLVNKYMWMSNKCFLSNNKKFWKTMKLYAT